MYKFCASLSLLIIIILSLKPAFAQQEQLRADIAQITKPASGIVGVAVMGLEDRDTVTFNGNARLVMHSVMKFPIAMAVLHQVDLGKLSLTKMIHIKKRDLAKNYSPLRDKYPKGNVDVSIAELLSYMVSLSDNSACDILLEQLGGTQVVEDYIHSLGIKGINISASEKEMLAAWEVQYTNWCKPIDMVKLLDAFYTGNVLSKTSRDTLYNDMLATSTGPNRIKGLLPKDAVVAHKTGTSPTNKEGLSPATNDVGIMTLPNGKHIAVAIFVCNSTANEAARDLVIAKIAKAVWDDYAR